MEVKDHVYGRRYLVFALLAGCFVFALAYANRTTFPFAWNDEARFYLPAFWWAEHFSLSFFGFDVSNGKSGKGFNSASLHGRIC